MTPGDNALRSLPHGPEFRFITSILELAPGQSATATYTVPDEAPFLRGHFPGNPLFPGVLLVEALAQLAGTIAQCDPAHPPSPLLKLTAIRSAKITGTARPGQTIRLHATVTGRLAQLIQAEGSIFLEDKKIAEASLTLAG